MDGKQTSSFKQYLDFQQDNTSQTLATSSETEKHDFIDNETSSIYIFTKRKQTIPRDAGECFTLESFYVSVAAT